MAQRNDRAALAREVMELIDVAHRRISRKVDLTRLRVLGLVAEHGPMRPAQIADALDLTASATSRHLTALQRDGRLEVGDDPVDDRTFLVGVAASGTGEVRAALAAGTERFVAAVDGWSDDEIDEARRVVGRLLGSFAPAVPVQKGSSAGARWRAARTSVSRGGPR